MHYNNLSTYHKRLEQRREEEAESFKRDMDAFVSEQEVVYTEIRKTTYEMTKEAVKKRRIPTAALMEFEIWKGF